MPANATPDDHLKTRKEFLRILSRWKARLGYRLELHGVLDIDDYLNAHWDVVAHSDAPKKPLRRAVSDAWSRAGGLRQSLVVADRPELTAVAKYQAKDTTDTKDARKYLPASQPNMGMNIHWSTSGFWIKALGVLWDEWKLEWFGKDKGKNSESCPIVDTNFRTKQVAKLRTLTPYADDYLRAFPWYTPEGSQVIAGGPDVVLMDLVG